jgi:hypothetical protein
MINVITPSYKYTIDQLFLEAFSKTLDIKLLEMNLGKFFKGSAENTKITCMQRSLINNLETQSFHPNSMPEIFNSLNVNRHKQELAHNIFTLNI